MGWLPDIDALLSSAELDTFLLNERVEGLLMKQSPRWRSFKKLSFWVNKEPRSFLFEENREKMGISVPERVLENMRKDGVSSVRCDYQLDGTKMSTRLLKTLEDSYSEGVSLSSTGIYLAKEQWLSQSDEQGIVEGLFKDLTDKEKGIIFEILNP